MYKRLVISLVLLLNTSFFFAQRQLELRQVNRMSDLLNSKAEESLPVYSPDGRLYFVRTLFDENLGGQYSGQDIWFAEGNEDAWTQPNNDIHPLNTRFNNAVIGIADSGRTLYLNGTYSSKPDYQIGVSVSKWKNGKWTRPKSLRIKGFNPTGSLLTYYVNGDIGVMLLSYARRSDPDNEDLYVSFLKKDRIWSKPESLGPQINTDADEFSAFIEDDGKSLFFSSNGHPGKGDADIFSAYRLDDTWQNWTTVTNLGEPINSSGFDAYYTRHGVEAFFASNRDNIGLADIYKADYDVVFKEPIYRDPMEDAMTKETMFSLRGFLDLKNPGRVGMVRVLNSKGSVVQRVKPNDDGSFLISGLNQYDRYSLDLDGQEKEIEDLEIFFVNQDGSRVYLNEGIIDGQFPFETLEKDIKAILMADVSDDAELEITQFNFDDGMELPAGSSIYLYDEFGNEQETSVVNRQGEFEFNTMKTGSIYKIELEEGTLDINSKLYLFYEGQQNEISGNILKGALFRKFEGQLIEIDPETEEGKFAYNRLYGDDFDISTLGLEDIEELDATTFGFEYGKLPPAGTKVSLVDENGNVVDEAYTDEFGVFKFAMLESDKKYSMQLDEAQDLDRDLSMYILDDDGMKVPVSKDVASGDEFAGAIATTVDASEDEDVFSFNYKSLPPAGTKVFLTDDNGNIIDSSYVDTEGNFKFKKLDADKPYKMMLSDELDNSSGIDFSINDSKGGLKKLGYAGTEGDRIFAGDAGEVGVDKFSFDFASLPKDGSMVYLTDQDGNVVDSSFVDANGNFRFKKLNPNETYLFKVDDEDFDMDAAKLYSLDDGQKRQLKKLPSSFSFNSMDLMDVADSEIDMSKYQLEYSGEIPDSAQAYLYDEETNEIIETAEIDENGNFSFKQLDSDRKFSIQFDDEIDETQAKFFVIEEEDVQLDIASAIDTSDTKDLSVNVDDESELKNNLDSDWVLYFGFNEYLLTDEQQLFIEREIIPLLNKDENAKVLIEGHADNKGSEAANKRMSTLRISNVVYHLEIRGFDDTRADIAPKGESSPVASNDTPEGRAKNRRVEIRIVR